MARGRNLRSSAPRRRMFWARMYNFATFLPTDVGTRFDALSLFEQEYGANLFGFTITRIRGRVRVMHDTTTVVERRQFDFGLRIATESSQLVGDDHLPNQDPHEDWMFSLVDGGQLTAESAWKEYEYVLDIKGQRRIDELGQSLFAYVGFGSVTEPPPRTADSQIFVELNVLCKRP